ncbi:MAG TPA: STAS domain-containing protein [Candidatus Omnitrophota bacterium]|nr:STAS domain-containing protein [Candidatus Omnitrophota bacterium]
MSRIVNVEKRGEGVFYVSINGSLDFDSYVEVQAAIKPLLESATKVIMVNMKNVDYISSVGIGVILKAKIFMEEKAGKFIMVELKPQVQTVFEIIKALPSMQIFENMKEVDDYFMKIQMDEMEKYKRRMGNNE